MNKTADLYRMVKKDHLCPYGLKSLDLLKRQGFKINDHHLTTPDEVQTFKDQHGVKTTPQTFIEGKRIGGFDDLEVYFGKSKSEDKEAKSYKPIIAVFSVTSLLALSLHLGTLGNLANFDPWNWLRLFVSLTMAVLAILKLRDLTAFSNQFITYDLLGKRWIRYAFVYPFIEAIAAIGMAGKIGLIIVSPLALLIGTIGAASVFKAVYIEKRDLKCACVGGDSNVPLGFISLTENLMMIFMGLWMFP